MDHSASDTTINKEVGIVGSSYTFTLNLAWPEESGPELMLGNKPDPGNTGIP